MAEVKWIKITTDIFDNRKIKMLEAMPDGDTILVIWLKLLALAGTTNDNGLVYFTKDMPYTPQMLATAFNRPITTIELALKTFQEFGMIDIFDDIIQVSNWMKYQNVEGMDKIREQTRLRVARHREKQKLLTCNVIDNVTNVTSNVTVTQCNETEEDKELEIELINNNYISGTDVPDCSTELNAVDKNITKHFQEITTLWNSLSDIGITPIRVINKDSMRAKLLRARLREYGKDSFQEIVEQIRASDFLQGRAGTRSWIITFDWVVKPSNYGKVLEGTYRNADRQQAQGKAKNFVNIPGTYAGIDMAEFESQMLDN